MEGYSSDDDICGLNMADFDNVDMGESDAESNEEEPSAEGTAQKPAVVDCQIANEKPSGIKPKKTESFLQGVAVFGEVLQLKCDWDVGIGGGLWT